MPGDPPDEIVLFRLVWHPDAWHNGVLTGPGSFKSYELDGRGGYASVDRADRYVVADGIARALHQQEKAGHNGLKREEAWNIEFECGAVRNLVDQHGNKPLSVTDKSAGYYPSHCGITNEKGDRGKKYLTELRTRLVRARRGMHILIPRRSEGEQASGGE